MHKLTLCEAVLLVACCLYCAALSKAEEINCQSPPQLTDPAQCCTDSGVDTFSELCFQRMLGKASNVTLSIEITSCLSECMLKEAGYLQEAESLNLDVVRSDLQRRFPDDSVFVDTMVRAFEKCAPIAQQRMDAFRELPLANDLLKRSCSPFSGITLGCTFIEYVKSCPKHLWLDSVECNLTRDYLKQCS